MSKKPKINFNLINTSEIARQLGYTPQYISMLLHGKRKNQEILDQVYKIIKDQVKAA